jgi:hypothetical protein
MTREKDSMSNIRDLGDFNDQELEAELAKARRKRGGSRDGRKLWEVIIHQKDLPCGTSEKPLAGTVEFKILPADDRSIPWVSISHHEIWQETAIVTPKRVAKFNCADAMTDGRERCPAEAFLARLEKCGIPGAKMMSEKGRAKKKFFMNVEFTKWAGGPVPEDKQGVRPFEFGLAIQKGTAKEETLGLLKLLAEYKGKLTDPTESVTVRLTKTLDTREPLDTTYQVSVVETREDVLVQGRTIKMNVPVLTPLGANDEEITAKMEDRKPLGIFTKLFTPDEVLALLADIDPMPLGTPLVGRGKVLLAAPQGKYASAQDELNRDDDLPDDFG